MANFNGLLDAIYEEEAAGNTNLNDRLDTDEHNLQVTMMLF